MENCLNIGLPRSAVVYLFCYTKLNRKPGVSNKANNFTLLPINWEQLNWEKKLKKELLSQNKNRFCSISSLSRAHNVHVDIEVNYYCNQCAKSGSHTRLLDPPTAAAQMRDLQLPQSQQSAVDFFNQYESIDLNYNRGWGSF